MKTMIILLCNALRLAVMVPLATVVVLSDYLNEWAFKAARWLGNVLPDWQVIPRSQVFECAWMVSFVLLAAMALVNMLVNMQHGNTGLMLFDLSSAMINAAIATQSAENLKAAA